MTTAHVGYNLLNANGDVVSHWGDVWGQIAGIPNPVHLPSGDAQVHCAQVGVDMIDVDGSVYRLEERYMEEPEKPFSDLSRPAFLFMMNKIGITKEQVETLIDAMPEDTEEAADMKALARIVFENQQTFKRDNMLLASLTMAAGLSSEQVDAAWRVAENLTW